MNRRFRLNLQQELTVRAGQIADTELFEFLGYKKVASGRIAKIRALLSDPQLGMSSSGYDFRYSNRELILTLADALGLDPGWSRAELARIEAEIAAYAAAFKPYIWIDTGFKRSSEAVWLLALLESRRYLHLERDQLTQYLSSNFEDRLVLVQDLVRQHAKDCGGELPVWGVIQHYHFYYAENQAIKLLANGDFAGEYVGKVPNQAVLTIKSREVGSSLGKLLGDADSSSDE
jgi:hypothetical protein